MKLVVPGNDKSAEFESCDGVSSGVLDKVGLFRFRRWSLAKIVRLRQFPHRKLQILAELFKFAAEKASGIKKKPAAAGNHHASVGIVCRHDFDASWYTRTDLEGS